MLFLEIPTSEINMSKDTKIIFISSDKLPSKKTEIIYTLTNSTGTYLKTDKSVTINDRANKLDLNVLIVYQTTAEYTFFPMHMEFLPVLTIWLGHKQISFLKDYNNSD